jgi:hypothetical protein
LAAVDSGDIQNVLAGVVALVELPNRWVLVVVLVEMHIELLLVVALVQ